MTAARLRQLRRQFTLQQIAERYFDPPITKERVRQLCVEHGITFRMYHRNGEHKRIAVRQLPKIDPRKAQQITAAKRAFWEGAA